MNRAFESLTGLLQSELERGGHPVPQPLPCTAKAFAQWYLEAVQVLEQAVAGADRHAPMLRREVELQARLSLSAVNLRQACELLAEFAQLLAPRAGRISLSESDGLALFELHSGRGRSTTASSLVDITGLFAFRQLLQWLAGRELPLVRVGIGPVERDNLLPFLRLFAAPVLAGGTGYVLAFRAAALDWPVIRKATEFPAFFESFPCNVLEAPHMGVVQQVEALLAGALQQGLPAPAVGELAHALELSESSLRRALKRAGTGYRQLHRQALQREAEALLRQDLPVSDVARRLGFSDDTAFRRAFHQWYGCAPGQWRRRDQSA